MAILIVLNALATNDAIQLQYWINHISFYSLNMKSRYEQLKPYQDSNWLNHHHGNLNNKTSLLYQKLTCVFTLAAFYNLLPFWFRDLHKEIVNSKLEI